MDVVRSFDEPIPHQTVMVCSFDDFVSYTLKMQYFQLKIYENIKYLLFNMFNTILSKGAFFKDVTQKWE